MVLLHHNHHHPYVAVVVFIFFVLSVTTTNPLVMVSALRHDFVVKQDARTFIAPIGAPYGFVKGGSFSFDVTHFDLHAGKRQYYKIGRDTYDAGWTKKEEKEDEILQSLDAGFLLKRFASEAAFAKYQEEIMSSNRYYSASCILEPFVHRHFKEKEEKEQLLHNYYIHDDIEEMNKFDDVGDVDAAGEGIFLPIRWHNSKWRTTSASSIDYTFQEKYEEGLYFLLYQVCLPPSSEEEEEEETTTTSTTNNKSVKNKKKKQPQRPELRTSFKIQFHYKNKDVLGNDSYLTAGELPLPLLFLYFFISYATCTILWMSNLFQIQKGGAGFLLSTSTTSTSTIQQQLQQQQRSSSSSSRQSSLSLPPKPKIYAIHHLMSLLMIFKSLTVLFESIRYHYIRVTGHAEFWSVVYYSLSFLKSIFLFVVILLIGSGWSFVKPFLNPREKWLICGVLVLQVLDNVALLILNTESEGENLYDDWSAVLHMLDIVCCGAILVPIVWQVNALEQSLEEEDDNNNDDEVEVTENHTNDRTIMKEEEVVGDDEALSLLQQQQQNQNHQQNTKNKKKKKKTLEKLKVFRTFYIIVVAYIYMTRIAVYLFATLLDYRHTWVRTLFLEMATLAFYVSMGMQFRPKIVMSSSEDDDDDDEEHSNRIKMNDNNDTKTTAATAVEIEMKTRSSSTTTVRSKAV